MKKLIYTLFILGVSIASFNSCKEEPTPPQPNHGSVSLDPSTVDIKYGEEKEITPVYSTTGTAKDKFYNWKNSNDKIISYDIITGGRIKVKGLRIGESIITYYAEDGSISAESKVSVSARTTLLGGVRFNPGESKTTVKNRVQWKLNERESSDNMLVYDVSMSDNKIKQEVYCFENDKLYSLLIILNDKKENETEAHQYIEERFDYLITAKDISYYDAGSSPDFTEGTVVGIFLPSANLPKEGISGKLGVRYTMHTNIN